ncbi:glycoside hydrolase family 9 protein [Bacteroidota bacterium]
MRWIIYLTLPFIIISCKNITSDDLTINDLEYFETQGLNVMVFHDYYPEGHQGGITIIQNGVRVASNGDLRLEPAPGQFQPVSKMRNKIINSNNNEIFVNLSYPDSSKNKQGFNPIIYPDFHFKYSVRVKAEKSNIHVFVDLEKPLPKEWVGKVGFNIELFPGALFGKTFYMDDNTGQFPWQANSNMNMIDGEYQPSPIARGKKLVIAPEKKSQMMVIENIKGQLNLYDGRAKHNNGWFIVRALIPENVTKEAIELVIKPSIIPNWKREPVIQVSQVGYHPKQQKIAVIETDKNDKKISVGTLKRITKNGNKEVVLKQKPDSWGQYLRYNYLHFNFSEITESGWYFIEYKNSKTYPFKIDKNIYKKNVWQPTLQYFLPVQMCHMRINENYRIWHNLCHMDDALMAPTNSNHFDGYKQGSSTLTKYKPLEHVPGLNKGGWHDAGDYDLRVESQSNTVYTLSLIYEEFNINFDETLINQEKNLVEIHHPDNIPDILQQIEHGVISIIGGYESLGRLYRGIICPTLRQYVMLGDASSMTDNKNYNNSNKNNYYVEGNIDDRLVFTEENPAREIQIAYCLAAASRVLKNYNNPLSEKCIKIAKQLWELNINSDSKWGKYYKPIALAELFLSTNDDKYLIQFEELLPEFSETLDRSVWALGRIKSMLNNHELQLKLDSIVNHTNIEMKKGMLENPYNVLYKPNIWGAGWNIQRIGIAQYYLHKGWPEIVSEQPMLHALNFILGCHPGSNTASFASGVGSNSILTAYGVNRADWSYIPGGVVSGTAIIRPDFLELKEWPFLWQQTEYVIGGGASNFMFLVLAADTLLNKN